MGGQVWMECRMTAKGMLVDHMQGAHQGDHSHMAYGMVWVAVIARRHENDGAETRPTSRGAEVSNQDEVL